MGVERRVLAEALGVSNDPTTGEIRRARRTIAHRLHPDAAGERGTALMAEVNAECDRWIAEIRARRSRRPEPAAAANEPTPPSRSELGLTYALATIALMAVVMLIVVAFAGASPASIAAGALLGSGAAGVYLLILRYVM